MKDLIAIIRSLLEGLDIRRRWLAVLGAIGLVVIALILFEQFLGLIFYSNLESKIDLLTKLRTLSAEGIATDSELNPIYTDLVRELEERRVPAIQLPKVSVTLTESFWKWVSGASLWLLLAILAPFGVYGQENKVIALIVLFGIGIIFGFIGSVIPTLLNPWVNYIVFPFLQLASLIVISSRIGRAKKE